MEKDNQRDRHEKSDKHDRQKRRTGTKQEGPKREAILDLKKYTDKKIKVKFIGGRQVVGVLKGFDQLMNLVLEDVEETLRDPEDSGILTKETRNFGQVVVRGPSLLTISPLDGSEIIDNPFVAPA